MFAAQICCPIVVHMRLFNSIESCKQMKLTRSSWLNCALRDDEAVYWVSLGHYEAVAVGN